MSPHVPLPLYLVCLFQLSLVSIGPVGVTGLQCHGRGTEPGSTARLRWLAVAPTQGASSGRRRCQCPIAISQPRPLPPLPPAVAVIGGESGGASGTHAAAAVSAAAAEGGLYGWGATADGGVRGDGGGVRLLSMIYMSVATATASCVQYPPNIHNPHGLWRTTHSLRTCISRPLPERGRSFVRSFVQTDSRAVFRAACAPREHARAELHDHHSFPTKVNRWCVPCLLAPFGRCRKRRMPAQTRHTCRSEDRESIALGSCEAHICYAISRGVY